MSPLQNHIGVGIDTYVIFAADGEGGAGDLYAAPAAGGPVYPLTYTRQHESAPALSPDGVMLAYVRARSVADSANATVWVMNLLSGSEREVKIPAGTTPNRLGWSPDGHWLFVRGSTGDLMAPAPPSSGAAESVGAKSRPGADSALSVLLGEPPFARVVGCDSVPGLCVVGDSGKQSVLTLRGRDPVRWGGDSVAYFVGIDLQVRPLRGGSSREPRWTEMPAGPRSLTVFSSPPPSPSP